MMFKKIFSDGWFSSIDDEFREELELDDAVVRTLDVLRDRISPTLYNFLGSMLQAFSFDMQMEMVVMMEDFMTDNVLKRTGCYDADYAMAQCYTRIGKESGIVDDDRIMEWFFNNKY